MGFVLFLESAVRKLACRTKTITENFAALKPQTNMCTSPSIQTASVIPDSSAKAQNPNLERDESQETVFV